MILRLIDIGITMRRLLAMLVGEVNFDEPSKLLRLDTNPRQTRSVPIFCQTRSGTLAHYLHALPYHLSLDRSSWPGATDFNFGY